MGNNNSGNRAEKSNKPTYLRESKQPTKVTNPPPRPPKKN